MKNNMSFHMSQQYMFNRHVFLFHVMCLHALSWHESFQVCVCVCVCVFIHLFCQPNLIVPSFVCRQ